MELPDTTEHPEDKIWIYVHSIAAVLTTAAPSVSEAAETRLDGILVDVSDDGHEVLVRVHGFAPEPAAEQDPIVAVDPVEVARVPRLEAMHQALERIERRANKEVEVVVQKAPCEQRRARLRQQVVQPTHEEGAVGVVLKDDLLPSPRFITW